ncbi:hypothetical protein [Halogeometricum luteum]|uniref:DUF7847 domain-containing protein n=1 Tax=Halogeometricum luteum TaxID=2950537 RepID=A0ABU2G595_9EURY|nr:hypothetical protein [Halogeometricum sp. S3BR5-2]MDS0295953.1 hypothetical protein [Halogeometricum sp. S3BR5-2]
MSVLQSLRSAGGALRRNPILAGVMLLVLLVQLPTQFAQLMAPTGAIVVSLGSILVTVFVTPFVFAGLVGMAEEALDGDTGFGTLVEAGKKHYASMLGAYLLVFVGVVALAFVGVAVVGGLGVAVSPAAAGAGPLANAGVLVAATLAFLLVLFVPLFFVQFYGQAIVLDDEGFLGGFERSVSLVRRNLASVFGYTVLTFGVGLVFGVVASVPSTLLSVQVAQPTPLFPDLPLSLVVGFVVVADVLMALFGAFFLLFSVAFYRTLDGTTGNEGAPPSQRTVA